MTETYGQMIARLREQRGWSQEDLARAAGVPKRTIQDVELDKVQRPQRRTRTKLQAALGIEGDPEETRSSWPTDVQVYLDVMGAFLSNFTEARRLEIMREITTEIMRPQLDGHHPNGEPA